MSNDDTRPTIGTLEHKEWVREKMKKRAKELLTGEPNDFESELGLISGGVDYLIASDAELFPDELEEYTPEERRKLMKEVKKDD